MMMFFITVPERIGPDAKGNYDHKVFKSQILDDIYTEDRQTG